MGRIIIVALKTLGAVAIAGYVFMGAALYGIYNIIQTMLTDRRKREEREREEMERILEEGRAILRREDEKYEALGSRPGDNPRDKG